jgi:hypothetical protein
MAKGLKKEFRTKKIVTPATYNKQKKILEPEKIKYKTELWLIPK